MKVGERMINRIQMNDRDYWIVIETDRGQDHTQLYDQFDLDSEIMEYALDKNERAHIDYDAANKTLLLIFNVLKLEKEDNHYETIPVTFVSQKHRLITIVNQENRYILNMMEAYLKRYPDASIFSFLFGSLSLFSERFFPIMEEIDRDKDKLNSILRQKTTKKHLLDLSDLETGNVYLVSAASQNRTMLEQLRAHAIYRRLNDEERDDLDDAIIEANQLYEMTHLTSQILQQLSGTYNNVLNNNLNDNLTYLNIVSILLGILAVITGFFGMNVPLPFTKENEAWIGIIIFSAAIWFIVEKVLQRIFPNDKD
ncbi:magnesium transporter CorA family protein [Eremococcus coleocola]|uniref:CorA-like protein n=1 Tax=Eremococcus coleocola ACS-139-V-Col8 TaxID=908337 RepID=E4KMB6_9LACT|nr:magnesium transporter CorA family protein [Eremococcus coleocola]EFR31911.1 CorA-like protein [Eremococcus coleocola ACS-139-V-Col8]